MRVRVIAFFRPGIARVAIGGNGFFYAEDDWELGWIPEDARKLNAEFWTVGWTSDGTPMVIVAAGSSQFEPWALPYRIRTRRDAEDAKS